MCIRDRCVDGGSRLVPRAKSVGVGHPGTGAAPSQLQVPRARDGQRVPGLRQVPRSAQRAPLMVGPVRPSVAPRRVATAPL
eukprot:992782-Alexandrium_andersonii.AAC.1